MSYLNLPDVPSNRWQRRFYFGLGYLPLLLAGEGVLNNMLWCSDNLRAGQFEVRIPVGTSDFSSLKHPARLWGPPCLLFNGYRALSGG